VAPPEFTPPVRVPPEFAPPFALDVLAAVPALPPREASGLEARPQAPNDIRASAANTTSFTLLTTRISYRNAPSAKRMFLDVEQRLHSGSVLDTDFLKYEFGKGAREGKRLKQGHAWADKVRRCR
jgi:hypothetical protein